MAFAAFPPPHLAAAYVHDFAYTLPFFKNARPFPTGEGVPPRRGKNFF